MATNADLDKRLAVQETKLDTVISSVDELKCDMKDHREESIMGCSCRNYRNTH